MFDPSNEVVSSAAFSRELQITDTLELEFTSFIHPYFALVFLKMPLPVMFTFTAEVYP